ncbi:hypothetical protein BS47DRAFT_1391893 [Hydnum rufescens UP504]|uniref:Uncharacterized protein n=1 Tax=Hydnum rufescens UP504 TaxID=1448309 RepID=A0A9P6B007_9AGAM|nr:hypothetical protein BS47DRAFT_1391893 [Hydnum rufescens UP504]
MSNFRIGIKHSGAWYLLIPGDGLARPLRCTRPAYPSTDFASLSPIAFTSLEETEDKLKALRQDSKKNKKIRTRDQSERDTSKANNSYSLCRDTPARITYGKDIQDSSYTTITNEDASCQRSAFEHSRVILGALRKTLRVSKFIIGDSPWNGLVNRLIVFASTPSSPEASRVGRVPLDISCAEVLFSEAGEAFGPENHFFIPKGPSKYEGSDPHSLNTDFGPIRAFFRLETVRPRDKLHEGTAPTILLVYDAVSAFRVLQEAGVDTTNWELGATSLVLQTGARQMSFNLHRPHSHRPTNFRPRSRSPTMNREHNHNSSPSSHRPASPSRGMGLAPVYVIDIRSLWLTMPGMSFPAPSLLDMAYRLNLDSSAGSSLSAGNDLDLVYRVWTSLVGAAPIDDQAKVIRPGPLPSLASTADSEAPDPMGTTQKNCKDEDNSASLGKFAGTSAQPVLYEDPYSAFEKWASEDEDLDE